VANDYQHRLSNQLNGIQKHGCLSRRSPGRDQVFRSKCHVTVFASELIIHQHS
jgi:hypothetical protein